MNRETAYWLCQAGGWGLYFTISFPLAMTQDDYEPKMALLTVIVLAMAIGITHLYRLYLKRHGWIDLPPKKLIPRAIAAMVILTLVATALSSIVQIVSRVSMGKDPVEWHMYVLGFFGWGVLMLAWSLFYYGIHFFWHFRKAEIANWKLKADFREAELRALKAQVNPHFIFNMLNNLRGLILENPHKAQEMVTRMAKLLRASFQSDKDMLVPLETELAIAENYLQLEAVRLEERLRYQLEIPPETLSVPVPAMLVQTLVENGIKHGISGLPKGGEVSIRAALLPDPDKPRALSLTIGNTGSLTAAEAPAPRLNGKPADDDLLKADNGIGLRNARERLRLHYGPGAELALTENGAGWVTAAVTIPLEAGDENADRR